MYKKISSLKKFKYTLKTFRKKIIPLLISLFVLEQERRREGREGEKEGREKERQKGYSIHYKKACPVTKINSNRIKELQSNLTYEHSKDPQYINIYI